jgi:hypothetical protein
MTLDLSTLKPGDEVTVKVVVVRKDDDDSYPVRVCARGDHRPGATMLSNYVDIPVADIVSISPRPLEVGDRVRVRGHESGTATLLAVDGDWCWAKYDHDGARSTSLLSDLERIP